MSISPWKCDEASPAQVPPDGSQVAVSLTVDTLLVGGRLATMGVAGDFGLVDDAVVGWAVTLGVQTLVGPIVLEWSDASTGSGDRLSISVGRLF